MKLTWPQQYEKPILGQSFEVVGDEIQVTTGCITLGGDNGTGDIPFTSTNLGAIQHYSQQLMHIDL